MSATTPFLNLYKPGGGSTGLIVPDEVVDVDRFNTNFDSIDAWAQTTDTFRLAQLARNQQYRGTAAGIGSVSSPLRGDTYQETDGSFLAWEYNGTNWVNGQNGMYRIRPSSVTGHASITIDTDGSVIFNDVPAASVCNILGVFSSDFRNYKVIGHASSKPGASYSVRGLVGGVAVSSANHNQSIQSFQFNARSDVSALAQTGFGEIFFPGNGTSGSFETTFFSPQLAQPTMVLSKAGFLNGNTAVGVLDMTSGLSTNDQLTGIQITLPTGGTFTGRLTVYGLA